tara:strand:+ start:375 stop:1079 length:705 start_codon:yes stop_codon:yes gene_type:complete
MEKTMKLPSVALPKYQIYVPSSGEKVFYRPFVVKEEKVLLIALESGEYPMIAKAIKDIVDACTYGQLKTDQMPIFDLCYLFLNIRAKSVGETVEPNLICQSCTFKNPIEINLSEIQVMGDLNKNKKLNLGENVGMVLKYPALNSEEEISGVDISLGSIADCIEMIYEGDNVFKSEDINKKELVEFIENLTHHQFELILEFFADMPRLSHTVKYNCSQCGKENEVTLEGLGDFFL